MADATKDELLTEARALGLDVSEDNTKTEIQAALDQQREGHAALGPTVPLGQDEPTPPESSGESVTGVAPQTMDDVPEELR